jgi:hypothetical protein
VRKLRIRTLVLGLAAATGLTCVAAVPALGQEVATLRLELRGNGSGVVSVGGTGCREDCRVTLPVGTAVPLAATPDPGSTFLGWSGACGGTGACEVRLEGDLDVVARFGDTYRPGLMIRRPSAEGYRGRWVVDASGGPGQTVRARAGRGERATFLVRVVNDGLVPDEIALQGTGDRGGAAVAYRYRGEDVTAGVVDGTLVLPELAPGQDEIVRVVVEVSPTAAVGAERAWTLLGRSAAEPASADAVRAEVRVVWRPVSLARAVGITLVEPGREIAFAAYHQSLFGSAAALEPLGPAIVMRSRGRGTPLTSAVDVVMSAGAPVLAPVTGRVASVTPYRLYCDVPDVRIVIRPAKDRTRTVLVLHVAAVRVSRGDRVEAGRTVLGVPRDLGYHDQVDDYGAAGRPHVHLEIERDGSSPLPGCR